MHNEIFDRMSGEERVRIALEMSDAVRDIRLTGIRAEHPGASEREVIRILVREEYGIELPGES